MFERDFSQQNLPMNLVSLGEHLLSKIRHILQVHGYEDEKNAVLMRADALSCAQIEVCDTGCDIISYIPESRYTNTTTKANHSQIYKSPARELSTVLTKTESIRPS